MLASFTVRVDNLDKEGFNKTASDKLTFDLVQGILQEGYGRLATLRIRKDRSEGFGPGQVLPAGNYICECESEQGTQITLSIVFKLDFIILLSTRNGWTNDDSHKYFQFFFFFSFLFPSFIVTVFFISTQEASCKRLTPSVRD